MRTMILTAATFCALTAAQAIAEDSGTSSAKAEKSAKNSIPYDQLSEEHQQFIRRAVGDRTIFRRMPVEHVASDPELFLFLVNRLDLLLDVWSEIDQPGVRLRQTGPNTYLASDRHGTAMNVEFVHRSAGRHVLIFDGVYKGPLVKRGFKGRGVVILESAFVRDAAGGCDITNRLDFFLQIDNTGVAILARVANFLAGDFADDSFRDATRFLNKVNTLARTDPQSLVNVTAQLDKVHPEIRQQFVQIVSRVASGATDGLSRRPE